ncbi:CvpA family protein [Microaerobacter geothermalis]|uniref:CvpA family protein n=1 Tax=Microaerobacter geothermalis TaxID=674972 RepID=UPI001F417AD4|nr:CvpA family protein [Microaerobacter geothermalis]MCF6092516.1 CvpA family protein [Microaerobacter geothermalis]
MSGAWVDLVIVLFLTGSLFMGFQRGFIRQSVQLAGFFLSLWIAYRFFPAISPVLKTWVPFPSIKENAFLDFVTDVFQLETMFYNAIAFALLFFTARLVIRFLGNLLHFVFQVPVLATANRFLGLILAGLESLFIIILVVNLITVLPFQGLREPVIDSQSGSLILKQTPYLTEELQKWWKKDGESPSETPDSKKYEV